MNFSRNLLFITLFTLPYICFSQNERPKPNWQNLDLQKDGVPGMSTEKAYEELLINKESKTVVVAVIDGGVDINHEDLQGKIWVNEEELANDSTDNDGNGYINDRYGWNFIGNKNGQNVEYDNLEVLRLVRELHPKYVSVLPTTPLAEDERREFLAYQQMNTDYMSKLQIAQLTERAIKAFKLHVDSIIKHIDKDTITVADIKAYKARSKDEDRALSMVNKSLRDKADFDSFYEELVDGVSYYENQVNYHLNMQYDSRHIVGDTYENSTERFYGNADVIGPDAKHGTHVAGIIAADRNNGLGIRGVADDVKVMVLRVVPNGDERDKDVANAITYAVDMGAKVINMSFGKAYVKDKQIVDKAVKYAMDHDVLLVHAAGNDGKDNDVSPNYPNKNYVDSLGINMGIAPAWIEVGATGWKYDASLVADFSNYGKRSVDVFAPGVGISSTIPHSQYKEQQGTSMAAPMVSGLAALIRAYYPKFKANDVKKIILDSVVKPTHSVRVMQNGSRSKVALSDISTTGGIVNAYNALVLAEKLTN